MIKRSLPIAILLGLICVGCSTSKSPELRAADSGASSPCPVEGRWFIPRTGEVLSTAETLDRIATARVVLLGESHDRPDDHRWQLQTIAALQGRHADIVLAFEMLPRSSQPALDAWSRGTIEADEFVVASRWQEVWGYPIDLYMPILDFGRMNRTPLAALNVSRALVRRVSNEGWDSIPLAERGGLSDPAHPPSEYRTMLESVYGAHLPDDKELDPVDRDRFIEAQLLWDRAFAEGIAEALRSRPSALVVALIGRGHLEHGYGVPHQLSDLGIENHVTLLPWEVTADCGNLDAPEPKPAENTARKMDPPGIEPSEIEPPEMEPNVADALFGVGKAAPAPPRPRLGVFLEPGQGGVLVRSVLDGSVAQQAGILPEDLIVGAAGRALGSIGELKSAIAKQPLGTTLPLRVRRGERTFEVDARFPVDQ